MKESETVLLLLPSPVDYSECRGLFTTMSSSDDTILLYVITPHYFSDTC